MILEERRRIARGLLLAMIPLAHEAGHLIIYSLLHPRGSVWIEMSWLGLQTKYLYIFPWAVPWVFAGGLIFTIPFVLLCRGWLSWSWWGGWMLYGLIETVWGLML